MAMAWKLRLREKGKRLPLYRAAGGIQPWLLRFPTGAYDNGTSLEGGGTGISGKAAGIPKRNGLPDPGDTDRLSGRNQGLENLQSLSSK